jgi:hypothetical protein
MLEVCLEFRRETATQQFDRGRGLLFQDPVVFLLFRVGLQPLPGK